MSNLVSRPEAARYLSDRGLRIAAATLAKLAVTGLGPPYRIALSRAVYDTADLDAWAASRLGPKLSSTADRDARAKP